MYSIQFSDWGLILEFRGRIADDIIHDWLGDVQQLSGGLPEGFGVIIDLRRAQPGSPLVSARILQGLVTLKQAGMVRSATVTDDELGDSWALPEAPPSVPGLRSLQVGSQDRWLKQAHGWVQDGTVPSSRRSANSSNRRATS